MYQQVSNFATVNEVQDPLLQVKKYKKDIAVLTQQLEAIKNGVIHEREKAAVTELRTLRKHRATSRACV